MKHLYINHFIIGNQKIKNNTHQQKMKINFKFINKII